MIERTRLEADVLAWIASHADSDTLRRQLAAATVEKRKYTGCGFFVDLSVPASLPRLQDDELKAGRVLGGPYLNAPGLEHGGGSLLFIKDGVADFLELYCHGEVFPEHLDEYTLFDG